MRLRAAHAFAACCLSLTAAALPARGADLQECIKLEVQANGSATLTNVCGSRLNFIYCIDNLDSDKACTSATLAIVTLSPGASDRIPSYVADGAGVLRSAVGVYPEAPVGWKPGAGSAFACRKTCVMC
jgi:hypothetical protein